MQSGKRAHEKEKQWLNDYGKAAEGVDIVMKMVTRRESILDGDIHMEELFRLKNFPAYMGTTAQNRDKDLFFDLIYEINTVNGEVQIRDLISEQDLYQEAHYNNIGSGWKGHHQAFAEFVAKYRPKRVLEIGGGRGLLSVEYSRVGDADWTILEPVPNPVQECKAHYVKGFFDSKYKIEKSYDAIIHTHTLEHFYNPVQCIRNMGNVEGNKWMFFSIPNMEEMIKRCYTNVMNFEHTFYCAEPYVTYFCSACGYTVMETKKYKEDHSIFYAAKKTGEYKQIQFSNIYHQNKKRFMDWKRAQEKVVNCLNRKLENNKLNRKIYLFGAHVNTQFLLAFQLQVDKIKGIIDNDPSKQGKRLYGTPFQVYSSEVLRNQNKPIIILRSGTHNDEIRREILKINATVEIWGD